MRHGDDGDAPVLVACSFTPAVHRGVRLGVPRPGTWRERINTDAAAYGGSNVGTPLGAADAEPVPSHGQPWSILVDLPPLATVMFEGPQ